MSTKVDSIMKQVKSLTSEEKEDFLDRILRSEDEREEPLRIIPFKFLERANPAHLLAVLEQEHPQTISVVLSHLMPDRAAAILSSLSSEIQGDVIKRISKMDYIDPDILREVERILEKRISTVDYDTYINRGGIGSVVEIINMVEKDTENNIIEILEDEEPELAEIIKNKLFVFEDILMLSDRDIQKVMREVDSQELAKALKGVDAEVQEKIFRNMSKRAAAMLMEDMDYMGPIRLKDAEAAQQKIVSIITYLEKSGEINIIHPGKEEVVGEGKQIKDNISFFDFVKKLNEIQILEIHKNIPLDSIIKSLVWVQPFTKNKLLFHLSFWNKIKYNNWINQAKKRVYNIEDIFNAQQEIMTFFLKKEEEKDGE